MKRLLLGGSPCTYWSIAQKNNRETEASGIGWELFKNYLIAKEKFKPDCFLYENNVSAAQPIKDQIKRELNVWDGTFLMPYSDVRYIEINSALVSAQNRERFYVHNCGAVELPQDRGILLKDILESGCDLTGDDKSYALTTRCNGAIPEDTLEKHRHTMVAEPVIFQLPHGYNEGGMKYGKAPTLTANGYWQENNKVIEPICVQEQIAGRKAKADGSYDRRYEARTDGKSGCLTPTMRQNAVAEPIACRCRGRNDKSGKSYGKYECRDDGKGNALTANPAGRYDSLVEPISYHYATEFDSDGKPTKAYCFADGKTHTVYKVKDGKITIKGKQYPIKLVDGFYIIRKLTVNERRRLQTIPDWYQMPCSDTQNYKMLGNGWTIEVIKHILSHIPEIAKGEPIEVLSMYDGMSCGRIALKELGANVVRYYATEIDKYAIQTTQANFPDTIQLGDAFQVRDEGWNL